MQIVDGLRVWINRNYVHPDIVYWLPCYIKLHGTRCLEVIAP